MKDKKVIVIYFSRADENYAVGHISKGNTEVIAEYIRDITGADLFKVERKVPYSKDYNTCTLEAKREQQENARPELVNTLDNILDYDVVYIGSPIWWEIMPQPLFTQLERLDFSGKIVRVFTTHEGSGLGNIVSDVKRTCKGANVLDNSLAIYGSKVKLARDKVENWINS